MNCSIAVIAVISVLGCRERSAMESRVVSLPYYDEAQFTPKWLEPQSESLAAFHKIPAFSLINQDGRIVTEKTFQNKIYVADFIFTTCPGICPKMTANMSLIQERYQDVDEVLLLSHSVTPEIDSVPVLKTYSENKGMISGKWHLVTGSREEIYDLGRHFYFAEEDLGLTRTKDEFLHTENFVLIDKNRHIRGIYNGLNKTAVKQLIADIETLKSED